MSSRCRLPPAGLPSRRQVPLCGLARPAAHPPPPCLLLRLPSPILSRKAPPPPRSPGSFRSCALGPHSMSQPVRRLPSMARPPSSRMRLPPFRRQPNLPTASLLYIAECLFPTPPPSHPFPPGPLHPHTQSIQWAVTRPSHPWVTCPARPPPPPPLLHLAPASVPPLPAVPFPSTATHTTCDGAACCKAAGGHHPRFSPGLGCRRARRPPWFDQPGEGGQGASWPAARADGEGRGVGPAVRCPGWYQPLSAGGGGGGGGAERAASSVRAGRRVCGARPGTGRHPSEGEPSTGRSSLPAGRPGGRAVWVGAIKAPGHSGKGSPLPEHPTHRNHHSTATPSPE
ncbi:hypothetical protein I4F81_004730 [Pyropia yezoensis]|uniref:Uncharacterized protein n=1 Tax=Pyropia yezoensis TaxID=2788 RepID=A0ACC3BW57_PYRYE|nr:hypothetical protein I4F81_004730 [Neopyropia yezoensis]